MDVPGPMGKSVWDLAAMMEALTGVPYLQYVKESDYNIAQYKLGVPRLHFNPDDQGNYELAYSNDLKQEAVDTFEHTVKQLNPALDPVNFDRIERLWQADLTQDLEITAPDGWKKGPNKGLILTEYYHDLNNYLTARGHNKVKDLKSLVEWNEQNPVSHQSISN